MVVALHAYQVHKIKNPGINAQPTLCRIMRIAIPFTFIYLFALLTCPVCAQSGGASVMASTASFLWADKNDLGFYEYCALRATFPKEVEVSGIADGSLNGGSNGFHGIRLTLEPAIARLNFHHNLPYRNTWMGGAYAGLDFNKYIGFRGFIFKAMNDGKIKLDFDKLYLYGGEFRLRPHLMKYLTPTLMLGGGYLRVDRRYIPRDGESRVGNQIFTQAGFGLTVPVSECFHIAGGARAVFSSNMNGTQNGHGIVASCMYNFGIKVAIGRKNHYR